MYHLATVQSVTDRWTDWQTDNIIMRSVWSAKKWRNRHSPLWFEIL